MEPRSILRLTLGTAGHIDHGKTSLVRALVGAEAQTDRLKEERDRGLTIDIGYAEWKLDGGLEVGIIDVPGHERFVRNMVAGATGMDCVLLVVAADDGVMPQTREHLQIMTLLGLRSGAVAVTKIDMVDEEMRELVMEDIRDLLRGTFLEGAGLHPVSNTTGEGLPELRRALETMLRAVEPRDPDGPFRMPVQRVFTVRGHGTVATGIPVSGTVRRDDRLELLPQGRAGRVRGIQVYHRDAPVAGAGHRTALNLADIDYHSLGRGDVLVEPGIFRASSLFDARFRCTAEGRRGIPHRHPVKLLVGTAEAEATLLLLEGDRVSPGSEVFVQIATVEPVVAAPGDRFILRVPSPASTIGGGVLLGDAPRRRPRKKAATLEAMAERLHGLDDAQRAVRSVLTEAGPAGADVASLACAVRRRPAEIRGFLASLVQAGDAVAVTGDLHLSAGSWEEARRRILAHLDAFHAGHRLRECLRMAELRSAVTLPAMVVDAAVQALASEGVLDALPGGRVRRAGAVARPTADESRVLATLEALLRGDGFATPREEELPEALHASGETTEALLALLVERGRVLRLGNGVVLHNDVVEDARGKIAARIGETGGILPADLKDLVGATRKFGIPFLEHLDSIGFTMRVGDRRVLRR
jgi:selenocysteine-specific elongation factor